MRNVRIAVIDSGFCPLESEKNNISESYILNYNQDHFFITEGPATDYIGHGTAVAHNILSYNKNVELIIFRVCESTLDVDENGLVFVLDYIHKNMDVEIINISAGITYLFDFDAINNICKKLENKGVIIISAFDNDGAISYPAALSSVIGVDINRNNKYENEITVVNNGLVDIIMPDKFYRTMWLDKKTILKGTSFACAHVTGLIAALLESSGTHYTRKQLLSRIGKKATDVERNSEIPIPGFKINKAIIFPINKEMDVLLRFKDLLDFDISGVYDEKLTGRVGKMLFGEQVHSYENICWKDDFDTVILSNTSDLAAITRRNYSSEILDNAIRYNKNIYSLEDLHSDYKNYFYPYVDDGMIPYKNLYKLHKTTIPVVGVFGTSSKQGKFTLQQKLISELSFIGYKVGSISTEPSGYLLNMDYVFHFGYKANLTIQSWQIIALLNEMLWEVQLKGKDVLVTGCQSGIIHYNDSQIGDFNLYQYAFLLGVMPDVSVLCVNPHDDIAYIKKSIDFINSVCEGKVKAISVFPIKAIETLSGVGFSTEEVKDKEMNEIKDRLKSILKISVFSINDKKDIQKLTELIVDELSAEND